MGCELTVKLMFAFPTCQLSYQTPPDPSWPSSANFTFAGFNEKWNQPPNERYNIDYLLRNKCSKVTMVTDVSLRADCCYEYKSFFFHLYALSSHYFPFYHGLFETSPLKWVIYM